MDTIKEFRYNVGGKPDDNGNGKVSFNAESVAGKTEAAWLQQAKTNGIFGDLEQAQQEQHLKRVYAIAVGQTGGKPVAEAAAPAAEGDGKDAGSKHGKK